MTTPNHVTTEITGTASILPYLVRTFTEAERIEREQEIAEYATLTNRERMARGLFVEPKPLDMAAEFIDFAILIPQPDNIETGGCSGTHDDGVVCWYEWNVDNWGTKWNAYNTEWSASDDGNVTVRFDTAWSHPSQIIAALGRALPHDTISVRYADEDLGSNFGTYVLTGSVAADTTPCMPGSAEARDLACDIKYGQTYAEVVSDED